MRIERRSTSVRGSLLIDRAFISARTPFTPDLREIFAYQVDGRTDEQTVARAARGLKRLVVAIDRKSHVPIRVDCIADSETAAKRWHTGLLKFAGVWPTAITGMRDDELRRPAKERRAKWEWRLLDRVAKSWRVERNGNSATLQVRIPGGMPRMSEFTVIETNRATRRAQTKFKNISKQLLDEPNEDSDKPESKDGDVKLRK